MTLKRFRIYKASILLLGLAIYSPVNAAWDQVVSTDLEAITKNMTWEGKGFTVYWKDDHTRLLISGDNTFRETWDIRKDGTEICSNGAKRGERCAIIEVKKGKYRSTRTEGPGKGKKFKFKVIMGILEN
jgi:hypothetical protein